MNVSPARTTQDKALQVAGKVATSIRAYFATPEYNEVEEVFTRRDGSREVHKRKERRNMPTLESWCVSQGISIDQLKTYAQKFQEIAEAINFARTTMKAYLIRNGLEGVYDQRFAIFVATNETDMKVSSEVVNRTQKGSSLLEQIENDEKPIIEGQLA